MEDLFQLVLIWVGAFLAVIVAKATRLTAVVYYLGVGAIFVNLGWLPEESSEFIRTLSEVGIIVIMFALGFEENANVFVSSIKKSWGIALFGAIAPFVVAYGVAIFFWGDKNVAIMCGLAMTATAVSLTMVSLKGEGLANSPVATRIMTSAVLDDIASLALIAVVIPIVTGEGPANTGDIFMILGKAGLFFVVITFIGSWIFPHEPGKWSKKLPFFIRYGMRHALVYEKGEHATLLVLIVALSTGLLGHLFGFHPAVGAYMAGLILREEYFHNGPRGSFEDTKRIVDNVAFSWIGPVFFVTLGARIHFDWSIFVSVIPQCVALILGIIVFQVTSAALAARYTGGMKPAASFMIGLGMLGRAELAFVVIDIAYVEHSILTTEAFYTLMVSCFFLNIAVPILIHWWKPRYEKELSLESPPPSETG